MKAKDTRRLTLFFLLSWMLALSGYASASPVLKERFKQIHSGPQIIPGDTLTVKDDKYGNPAAWNMINTIYSVNNVVCFRYNLDTREAILKSSSCTVDLEIEKEDNLGNLTFDYPRLKICYNYSGCTEGVRSSYTFSGAYRFTIKIISISYIDADANIHPPDVFMLEGETIIERTMNFDCTMKPLISSLTENTTNKRLVLTYDHTTGGNLFDIEWVFYDATSLVYSALYSTPPLPPPPPPNPKTVEGWFKNNATRVSTSNKTYDLSYVYPEGVLLFRIRSVLVLPDYQRVEGDWTYYMGPGTTYATFQIDALRRHMDNLYNWQYSAAFSEEGKVKEGVAYFDGTLRERQSNVRLNSNTAGGWDPGETVVNSTYYDYEGRPCVQALPTPAETGELKYFEEFDRIDGTTTPYGKRLFGTLNCEFPFMAPPMNPRYGTSRYYSPDPTNTLASVGNNQFTPDAHKFPFSQVEYTPDNSGRIKRQGGAGPEFNLAPGKHFTSYYYGQPEQGELSALFGSDAGPESHYTKEMMMDPNGQISVTYRNLSGQTVATGLAGQTPANLLDVFSNPGTSSPSTINLLGIQNLTNGELVSTHTYANAVPSNVMNLTYQVVRPDYTNCLTNVCLDCSYELEITVTDDCGTIFYSGVRKIPSVTNISCDPNATDSYTFNEITLPTVGTYNFRKVLRVDHDVLDGITEQYRHLNRCARTLDDFIISNLAQQDFSGCDLTCEKCSTWTADQGAFITYYIEKLMEATDNPNPTDDVKDQWHALAIQAYGGIIQHCHALCDYSPCEKYKAMMMADVTPPFGQYAKVKQNASTHLYEADLTLDDYGTPDGTGTSIFSGSPARYTTITYPLNEYISIGGVRYNPADLPVDLFVRQFQPQWAEDLLALHPEKCALDKCETNAAMLTESENFDNKLRDAHTFQQACNQGLLDPLHDHGGHAPSWWTSNGVCSEPATQQDPFFTESGEMPSGDPRDRSYFRDQLNNVYPGLFSSTTTIFQLASYAAFATPCSTLTNPWDVVDFPTGLCPANIDRIWILFRAMYLNEKAKKLNAFFTACVNCCPFKNCIAPINSNYTSCICNYEPPQANPVGNKIPRFLFSVQGDASFLPEACQPPIGNCEACRAVINQDPCTADASQAVEQNCHKYCFDNAESWVNAVEACIYPDVLSSTQHNDLKTYFITICQGACDDNHPFGATSCPSCTTITSFADAIHAVLGVAGPTPCDDIFTMPPPYNNSMNTTSTGSTMQVPTLALCGDCRTHTCSALNDMQTAMSLSDQDFYTWIITNYPNSNITFEDFEILKSNCAGNPACTVLSQPVQVPPPFLCNPACVSCEELAGKFAQVCTTMTDMSGLTNAQWQLQWPDALANAMNSSLNFSYSYSEYSEFMKGCGFASIPCNKIEPVYTEYHALTSPTMPFLLYLNLAINAQFTKDQFQALNCSASVNYSDGNNLVPTGPVLLAAYTLFMGQPGTTQLKYKLAAMYDFFVTNYWSTSVSPFTSYDNFVNALASYNIIDVQDPINPDPLVNCTTLTAKVAYYIATTSLDEPLALYLNVELSQHASLLDYALLYRICSGGSLPPSRHSTTSLCNYMNVAFNNYLSAYPENNRALLLYDAAVFMRENYWPGTDLADIIALLKAPGTCDMDFHFYLDDKCERLTHAYNTYFANNIRTPLAEYLNDKTGWTLSMAQYRKALAACGIVNLSFPAESTLCLKAAFDNGDAPPSDCIETLMQMAVHAANEQYSRYMDEFLATFRNDYIQHCMTSIPSEEFSGTLHAQEYQHTLYYYDQAGNLVKTVPPADPSFAPMQSIYLYNTLNKVCYQKIPDGGLNGGVTRFWYDKLGRLVASQNSEQADPKEVSPGYFEIRYSYILYDHLSRIIETGECVEPPGTNEMNDNIAREEGNYANWLISMIRRTQVVRTYYDERAFSINGLPQDNCRSRVSSTTYEEIDDGDPNTHDSGSHFDYDISGNVRSLVQENHFMGDLVGVPTESFKRLDYSYDLISGKVTQMSYQSGKPDAFIHAYEYDADNRLTGVQTSVDGIAFDRDADYFYYRHGPLARVVLGENKVQGTDYAYTLQGWLKGINSTLGSNYLAPGTSTIENHDMGQDGENVCQDVFGETLAYYDNTNSGGNRDYDQIHSGISFEARHTGTSFGLSVPSLYNGNIKHVTSSQIEFNGDPVYNRSVYGYSYKYDQLNRLRNSYTYNDFTANGNTWNYPAAACDYFNEQFKYYNNGNLHTLIRNGTDGSGNAIVIDNFEYQYASGTNQLSQLTELTPGVFSDGDISEDHSYQYDYAGNMKLDINDVLWNPAVHDKLEMTWYQNGKLRQVTHTDESWGRPIVSVTAYKYDPFGNRIYKEFGDQNDVYHYFYVRDVQGNIIAVYRGYMYHNLSLIERPIYGQARLGEVVGDYELYNDKSGMMQPVNTSPDIGFATGKKYEVTNHLGNVMAVVGYNKNPADFNSDGMVDFYYPTTLAVNDYYAYGSPIIERTMNSGDYRFGFNGQEKVDEICGLGNHNTAEYWEYDSRIAERWNSDIVVKPWESPYTVFSFNPVSHIDINGSDTTVYVNFSGSELDATGQKKFLDRLAKTFRKNGIKLNYEATTLNWDQIKGYLDQTDQFLDFGEVPQDAIGITKDDNFQHSTVSRIQIDVWKRGDINKYMRGYALVAAHEVAHGLVSRAVLAISGGVYHDYDFASDEQGHLDPDGGPYGRRFPLNLLTSGKFLHLYHSFLNDDWENDPNNPRALETEKLLPSSRMVIDAWFVVSKMSIKALEKDGIKHIPSQEYVKRAESRKK